MLSLRWWWDAPLQEFGELQWHSQEDRHSDYDDDDDDDDDDEDDDDDDDDDETHPLRNVVNFNDIVKMGILEDGSHLCSGQLLE